MGANDKAEDSYSAADGKPSGATGFPMSSFHQTSSFQATKTLPWSQPSSYKFMLTVCRLPDERQRPKEAAAIYRKAWETNSINLCLCSCKAMLKQAGNDAAAGS